MVERKVEVDTTWLKRLKTGMTFYTISDDHALGGWVWKITWVELNPGVIYFDGIVHFKRVGKIEGRKQFKPTPAKNNAKIWWVYEFTILEAN